jgi:(2Fe-2S) ferredoxin
MAFKAYQIAKIAPRSSLLASPDASVSSIESNADTAAPLTPATKSTILICQKSDCCKRGGRAVVQALEMALKDRNLADQVRIRATGCMKRCEVGPNLVMPDKTKYSQIHPKEIPSVIDRHFQTASPKATETTSDGVGGAIAPVLLVQNTST